MAAVGHISDPVKVRKSGPFAIWMLHFGGALLRGNIDERRKA